MEENNQTSISANDNNAKDTVEQTTATKDSQDDNMNMNMNASSNNNNNNTKDANNPEKQVPRDFTNYKFNPELGPAPVDR